MFNMESKQCRNEQGLQPHEVGEQFMTCYDCQRYVNQARLFFHVLRFPDGQIDTDLNVINAGNHMLKMVDKMELDEHYAFLKMMEKGAAMVSYAYSQKLVKVRIKNPDDLKKSGDEFKQALTSAKKENRPLREKKHLSDFEKAVSVLTAAGIGQEAAETAIREQFKAQGKTYE